MQKIGGIWKPKFFFKIVFEGAITPCTCVPPLALKKKYPTTHKRWTKINLRIAAQPLEELIWQYPILF